MSLNDHELTVLVEAAASGAYNSSAAHHGGPTWDALDAGDKNSVREHALPFIFHGTKALDELGFQRPRMVVTAAEVEELFQSDANVVLMDEYGAILQNLMGGWKSPGTDHYMTSDMAYHIYGPTLTVLTAKGVGA